MSDFTEQEEFDHMMLQTERRIGACEGRRCEHCHRLEPYLVCDADQMVHYDGEGATGIPYRCPNNDREAR